MRVILAGGGTGGHVIPALAIAQELRDNHRAEVIFVGTSRGIETRLVPAAGFALKLIDIGALKRVSLLQRLRTLSALPQAIFSAQRLMRKFRPDVVIGVGGYASGPAMLAATMAGVPTLAFEPNRVPGLANRLVGMTVSAAAVQFKQTCQYFRHCRVTGVPVRRAFFEVRPQARSRASELLVFGGSQGAHAINQAVVGALALLAAEVPGLQLVHQTGEHDYAEVQSAYSKAGIPGTVSRFIENMPEAFAHADLLLCRAGASTVAEITAAGKAAILVPFPRAADDHQLRNAETLAEADAGVLLPESELTPEKLAATVSSLMNDSARLEKMAANAYAMAHQNSAAEIAAMALRICNL